MFTDRRYDTHAYKYNGQRYLKDIPIDGLKQFFQSGFQSRVVCNRCHKPENIQMNLVQFIYSKMFCLNCLQVIAKSEQRVVGGKFSRQPTSNTDSNSQHMNPQRNLQEKVFTHC